MAQIFEEIRDAVLHLPTADKARILALVALDVAEAKPGIEFADGVCGGSARILRTRIPVWTLEVARRQGLSDAAQKGAFAGWAIGARVAAYLYATTHQTLYSRPGRGLRKNLSRDVCANDRASQRGL